MRWSRPRLLSLILVNVAIGAVAFLLLSSHLWAVSTIWAFLAISVIRAAMTKPN
jgi:hypothetical protein